MSDERNDPPGYVKENDLNQASSFTKPNVATPYPPASNPYQQQLPIYPQQYPPPYAPAPGTIPPIQQPYPPQYPPPPGMSPYPQYQPQYYAPQQQQQQQQQQSMHVVLGAQTAQSVVSSRSYYVNFFGAIALSSFVFMFCGCMFGMIAFIIASFGQMSAATGEYTRARQMLRASYGFSIAGIVIGIILIIILLAVFLSPPRS